MVKFGTWGTGTTADEVSASESNNRRFFQLVSNPTAPEFSGCYIRGNGR